MIFRLSAKLSTKIKARNLDALPPDDNPYADWSGHVFRANRIQYIILCNTKSLYSCVMAAKGITNTEKFVAAALRTIRECLEDDELEAVYRDSIAPASENVTFAKALNRAVTGSMNELVTAAERHLLTKDVLPHEVGYYLNDILLSAIAEKDDGGYVEPTNAFRRLKSGVDQ